MKDTYPEKCICLWSNLASRMTCLRYYCYECSLVVQENKNMYLKKEADVSYRVLVQGSLFFLQNLTHIKALQGVAFFNNTFGTFNCKKNHRTLNTVSISQKLFKSI